MVSVVGADGSAGVAEPSSQSSQYEQKPHLKKSQTQMCACVYLTAWFGDQTHPIVHASLELLMLLGLSLRERLTFPAGAPMLA